MSARLNFLSGCLLADDAVEFYVLIIVAQHTGDEISDFDGLAKRSPFLAFAMLIGMVFACRRPFHGGVSRQVLHFLRGRSAASDRAVVVGVITVGCGFYYYLKVVRAMYWQSDSKTDVIPVNGLSRVAISALIVATICWQFIRNQFLSAEAMRHPLLTAEPSRSR